MNNIIIPPPLDGDAGFEEYPAEGRPIWTPRPHDACHGQILYRDDRDPAHPLYVLQARETVFCGAVLCKPGTLFGISADVINLDEYYGKSVILRMLSSGKLDLTVSL